jgi:hypothetical protein
MSSPAPAARSSLTEALEEDIKNNRNVRFYPISRHVTDMAGST